jgi:hypothetical protein
MNAKKTLSQAVLVSCLILVLVQISFCEAYLYSTSEFDGWLVEKDGNGQWSEDNSVVHLWCDGGDSIVPIPDSTLYKEINPTDSFTFSLQIKADSFQQSAGLSGDNLQMGGIYVRTDLPLGGNPSGFNFEYDYYNGGTFTLAADYGDGWRGHDVASGEANAWYTMQLKLTPVVIAYLNWFTGEIERYQGVNVTASVYDANGQEIGSLTTCNIPFSISDLRYIGFTEWGRLPNSYWFRNIQFNASETITERGNASPSHLSIMAEPLSTVVGSPVNVYGTLTNANGSALANKTVVLSYNFPGITTWIPISSAATDENGQYNIQWINSASGTFRLKVEWNGDTSGAAASNQTSLSFLPSKNQENFIFESNSTIYDLGFNATASTLAFNVTGPSGTTGYVKATIAKSLLPDYQNLQVTIDGKPLSYIVDPTVDAWIFTFNYSHSTHHITLNIAAQSTNIVTIACLVGIVSGTVALCVGVIVYFKKSKFSNA